MIEFVPFYDLRGIKLLRILTDRGSEYKETREYHEYELYLAIEEIDHALQKQNLHKQMVFARDS
jgi:integrase